VNPDDFALGKADLDATFASEIVLWRFGGLARSDAPLLILIGAQPGAGKTRAGRDAIAASGQPVTSIIGDDLRAFHPDYSRLLKQAPADMPAATAQASGAWVERSIEFAAENRISTLVEGTFRNPAVTLNTARRFKERGFYFQAVLVAVSPEVSRASIAGRYVDDARRYENARFTPLKAHNDAYKALPRTIATLSAAGSPVDRLIVRNREAVLFDKRHSTDRLRLGVVF
jgi:UDP-N-acetylglucosamine kinase